MCKRAEPSVALDRAGSTVFRDIAYLPPARQVHAVVRGRERLRPAARLPLWQGITLGLLVLIWIGVSWLLVVSRGGPESFLRTTFAGSSRPDAFRDLNRTVVLFWVVDSFLVLTALLATRLRRPDVFVVLLVGPAIGLVIGLLSQSWSDPNWSVLVGVCIIGWLASILVCPVYWAVRSGR